MDANSQTGRASAVAELQLAAAPQLTQALQALARSACRQFDAERAAVIVDDGQERHVLCSDAGGWPDVGPASAVLLVDGRPAGSLQVAGSNKTSSEALADLAAIASALLESRLGEIRLRAHGERARSASAAGSDWLWETDAQGVLTWVSESVEAHTGWPASHEIGMHSMRLNRPPPGEAERESWDRYRAQREARLPFRDGIAERDTARGAMLVSMSGQPRFDADGRFLGYRGAARDVTAEVAQRHFAQRAQKLLLQAMEAVQAGIMISAPNGRVLMSNAAWQREVGRFGSTDEATWESLVRAMAYGGAYPDAIGREEEFIAWRLSLASPTATPHELRFQDQHVLVSDQRLPDGSTVHLSIDISERHRAEQERRLAEARMGAVLRAVPDLWFVVDRDDRYLLCSDESHPLLIEPFERQRGRPFGAVLPAPYDERAREALERARSTGEAQRLEYECTTRDGRRRVFEARVAPMTDGQVLYLTRDLTDQVYAAEQLRISEDLYRSVAATISDGLVVTGPDGRVLACNPSAGETLACDMAVLRGRRLSELGYRLHDEQDRPLNPSSHPVYRVLAGGPDERERALVLHRPDGAVRRVLLTARAMRDAAGQQARSCLVTFRDVTAEHAAAQALAAAEVRWRFALEGAGDGVWDYDEDTQQVFYSTRWKEMLGHAEHEIGTSIKEWSRRIHPDDYKAVIQAIVDYREGRSEHYESEHRLRHRDGHWVWVLDRGKIVERRPDGSPRRVVGIHTDISRLKQAEQALLDKQAAELASRAKSEFLSRMSHEMRTPLNAVIGFSQLLRMQPDGAPAKVAEYADHILRASEHLLGLVNEVLDLQRVEEGRTALLPQSIELAPFLESTLELLRPAALAQGIALTNQVPPGHWVWADARCLRQVLMNMVSNAVKYNRAGGWVAVSLLAAPPGRCVVAIEDTGSGLTDEQLARLFQPFERLGHETSGIEGSGLGLVITRGLIEHMGGTVSLSSVPGAGTLARIELPAADAPGTAPAPLDEPEPPAQPKPTVEAPQLRVLYVEDNRINALLFEEAMRLLGGIELRVAEDGAEALALVRSWQPQVLVLDANLPDMNGHELLGRLRELPALAALPAFMCSADAMPEDLERARRAGFHGYWTKPIEMPKVSAALDALRGTPPA